GGAPAACRQPSASAVWTAVPIATARGSLAIAASSFAAPNAGWLVGEGLVSTGPTSAGFIDQVQRWNGVAWTTTFDGFPSTQVQGVFAFGPADVWAVGNGMFHWDGSTWADLSPSGATADLFSSVWGVGSNDVWAGGDRGLFHWTGLGWTAATVVPPLDVGFDFGGMWGASANDVWAGGGYPASHDFLGILHWDGTSWSQVATSFTGFGTGQHGKIGGVWGSAANDVWAVGSVDGGTSPLWHYDGTSWTQAVVPALNGVGLAQVIGFCAADIWAAGTQSAGGAGAGAVFHYDGQTWSKVDLGISVPLLTTISGVSTDDLWVGALDGTVLHRHL
ncbi:MAG TPA: hypothetical protein VHM31_03360, partial [Polyangia bacterium]|nr:hypothetical protein [Polyangia bacterium]